MSKFIEKVDKIWYNKSNIIIFGVRFMKKFMKNICFYTLIFIFLISTVAFAGNTGPVADIKTQGESILSAILWAGYTISLGMVVFIGIKYITGAAETKSNMKTAIVHWLIGAFLTFMCTSIAHWVVINIASPSTEEGKSLADKIIEAAD